MQLNGQIVVFLEIQFSFSHLISQFKYQKFLFDPFIRPYHSGSEWTWEQWQQRGTQDSSNLQGRSLIINSFSVITGHSLRWELLPLCRDAIGVFYSPDRLWWQQLVWSELTSVALSETRMFSIFLHSEFFLKFSLDLSICISV